MTDNLKVIITDEISKDIKDKIILNQLDSYFDLIDSVIINFFDGKNFYLDDSLRVYKSDLYSFLSIINIQEYMLNLGLDINYSLYSMGGKEIDNFSNKYLRFSRLIDVYKLQVDKQDSIDKLKNINNFAKKYTMNLIYK